MMGEHEIKLVSRTERIGDDLTVEVWVWYCSCGARSRTGWFSKYGAGHAGQNHRQRRKADATTEG